MPAPAPRPPRRILYIESNEDGTIGGSHRALCDLVRNLDRARIEPVLLFYEDNAFSDELRTEGFEVHLFTEARSRERRIRSRGLRLARSLDVFGAIVRRYRFLRRHRIDAVHNNNSPRVGNDDWLPAARLRGIPIVAFAMGDARGAGDFVHRWLFRRFDRILPISDYMEEAMMANGVAAERLAPVRLGVDLTRIRERVSRSSAEMRDLLGTGEGRILVAMVGNIRRWKGQHVLLEALGHLNAAELSSLHVVFAGAVIEEGEEYQRFLEETVDRLELKPYISWLGARSDVPDIFAAADLAVHCSTGAEPFGLVLVEAMALGTPVAAANSGGPAEVVTPASGWLHDPSDPSRLAAILRDVIANPALLRERSRGALERARDFTIEQMVRMTMEAYAGVVT